MKKVQLILIIILFCGCDLPTDPGPMPTTIIETPFRPGLNVFGVLRDDTSSHYSYIAVDRAYEIEEAYEDQSDSWLDTALVTVTCDTNVWNFNFSEASPYGPVYLNDDFIPVAGQRYDLLVEHPGLPDLKAQTIFPFPPAVTRDSISIAKGDIKIIAPADENIVMYDVYVYSEDHYTSRRIVSNRSRQVAVIPLAELSGSLQTVRIYGYEENLASYLTNQMSIKPNTYNELVITVTNGYGCFGGVSVKSIVF